MFDSFIAVKHTTRQSVLLAVIFSVYALFATHSYYWDGVSFALTIEDVYKSALPFGALFHPNHLLYNLLGYGIFASLHGLGFTVRALAVLQGINVILSVCCGYVVFRIADFSFASRATAYFSWLLFAFGALWWEFSTDADAYIPATFLLVTAFFWLITRGLNGLPMVCLLHALAMMIHELSLFFLIPVLVRIWLETGTNRERRALWIAIYCAACALLVGLAYAFCFSLAPHAAKDTLVAWAGSHAGDAQFTYSFRKDVVVNAVSYVKLFLGGKFSFVSAYLSIASVIALLAAGAGLVYAVFLFRRRGKSADTVGPLDSAVSRRCYQLTVWWVLPYVLFLSIWLPQNGFYKLLIWPPLVLLLGRVLSLHPRFLRMAAALLVTLVGWNYAAYVYPRSHDSATPVVEFAKKVNGQLAAGTVIYYSSFVPDDWYLRYFTPHTEWRQFSGLDLRSPQRAISRVQPKVCFETTTLDLLAGHLKQSNGMDVVKLSRTDKWDLVSSKYNVRVRCLE